MLCCGVMSLSELLPAVHALPVADKRQLIELLADDLAEEEGESSSDDPDLIPPAHLSPRQKLLWRSARAAEILQELGAMGAFREIEDPAAWQREIRKDRPLPGREETD